MKNKKIISRADIRIIRSICKHYESDCLYCDICPLCNPNLHCNYDRAETYTEQFLIKYNKQRDKELLNKFNYTTNYTNYHKEYYQRNKKKINDYNKAYAKKNKEKIAAYHRKYKEILKGEDNVK